jgi:hypothetical protein
MQWPAYIHQTPRKILSAIKNPVGLDRIPAATNKTKPKYVGGQHSLPMTLTHVLGNLFPSCLISKLLRPSSDMGKSTERIYTTVITARQYTPQLECVKQELQTGVSEEETSKIRVSCNFKKTQQTGTK